MTDKKKYVIAKTPYFEDSTGARSISNWLGVGDVVLIVNDDSYRGGRNITVNVTSRNTDHSGYLVLPECLEPLEEDTDEPDEPDEEEVVDTSELMVVAYLSQGHSVKELVNNNPFDDDFLLGIIAAYMDGDYTTGQDD